MAVQENSVTVLKVDELHSRIIFLIGAVKAVLCWDQRAKTFIRTVLMWGDGRRGMAPRLTKEQNRNVWRQAYGIARSRGWTEKRS